MRPMPDRSNDRQVRQSPCVARDFDDGIASSLESFGSVIECHESPKVGYVLPCEGSSTIGLKGSVGEDSGDACLVKGTDNSSSFKSRVCCP